MTMTPDQIERATTWLSRRSITCGCGARAFTLRNHLVTVPSNGEEGSPLIMAITVCKNCARVHSYDAKTMGLL